MREFAIRARFILMDEIQRFKYESALFSRLHYIPYKVDGK